MTSRQQSFPDMKMSVVDMETRIIVHTVDGLTLITKLKATQESTCLPKQATVNAVHMFVAVSLPIYSLLCHIISHKYTTLVSLDVY